MLDDNLKIEKKESADYPPLPKNIYQCELLDINSEERPSYETKDEKKENQKIETVLNFQFTLLNGMDKGETLRGRNVWANFIPTYFYISKKSGENKTLRIVQALLGRTLNQQEEAEGLTGAFMNKLVGKQCRLGVEPKKSGDKTFDNITDYYAIETEMQYLTAEEKEKAKVKKKDDTFKQIADEINEIPDFEGTREALDNISFG